MKKKLILLAFVLCGAFYSCEDAYQDAEKEVIEEVQATEPDGDDEDSGPQGCSCGG
ncbi:MAG: hypothetical protein AAFQ94_09235 [Bacteroidota bacterium]